MGQGSRVQSENPVAGISALRKIRPGSLQVFHPTDPVATRSPSEEAGRVSFRGAADRGRDGILFRRAGRQGVATGFFRSRRRDKSFLAGPAGGGS